MALTTADGRPDEPPQRRGVAPLRVPLPQLTDPVRVYLLYLAEHMHADRKVSVPRKTIAKALGRSERRVTERVSAAHEAGFLHTVSAGYRGHVPVYQGIFPAAERETPTSPFLVPKPSPFLRSKGGHTGVPPLLQRTCLHGAQTVTSASTRSS